MSVTGKSTLSLRKKDVREQKNLAIGFKKTMFAHKATAGETGIDLTALVTPPEMSGFVNPTVNEMLAAQAFFYRKNMTIVSSLRGALMDFLAYNVASSSRIDFNGFTAEEGEIFVGVIDYNARNGLQVVDASAIAASGTLAIGSTDFNVGTSFETNKFSSQQVGAVIVFRNGVQQFRNSNNSSVNLDGNYYEVDNGSGSSQVIRFNNAPVSQSDSILVVSNGAVAYSPDGSALQAIETLAGQIDAMVPTLAALAGVPQTDFQAAPNNPDLKSFGDRVIQLEDRVWNQADFFEEITVSIPSPSVSGGSEVTNVANLILVGARVGKTITLGISFNFDLTTGNFFDQIQIPLSSFPFLSGKTVTVIRGSFSTNVNNTTSPGSTTTGYAELSGSNIALNFAGQFVNATTRVASGTIVIKVN